MDEVWLRIAACILFSTLFCVSTVKMLGAMQQSGYKGSRFIKWLFSKDNLLFDRLWVFTVALGMTTALMALCFSFLGMPWASLVSGVHFLGFCLLYLSADYRYALKVPAQKTGRFKRLFAVYFLFVASTAYALLALLKFLSVWIDSEIYAYVAFAPFAIMYILLPFLLYLANGVTSVFENARNKKFVKRAGQVLDETEMIRVGVVGSYGKTSVKNILKTILLEKYEVVATPESYNTPIGVAKTVFSPEFQGKKVFIAEMGARKQGDIKELCQLVKPDFAIFTGVCEQHIASFGSLDNVFAEKSEILKSGAFVVCGAGLKERAENAFEEEFLNEATAFVGEDRIENVQYLATETSFDLRLGEEIVHAKTGLLGQAAVENIALAAVLAYESLGLSAEEIERGIAKLEPIPHRLQLIQANGVYILDDGYNCNPIGAKEAIAALSRFAGRKCIVTPGLVECGVLEQDINFALGEEIAKAELDYVILVGETLVGAVKKGYQSAGGDMEKLRMARNLKEAKPLFSDWLQKGDCVLFLNDLPDVY